MTDGDYKDLHDEWCLTMMDPHMTDLDKLIDAVEAGEADHGTDLPFWKVWTPESEEGRLAYIACQAYNGSVDAFLALRAALLPGVTVRLIDHGPEFADAGRWNAKVNWEHMTWQPTFTAAGPFGFEGQGNDPARAGLLAILKAYRATRKEST